jgi:anti-sigma-K factor RskA/putative zinc finger protein
MNDQPMTHELARDFAAAYVLGALEPAEEAAVREHLLSCPEPHDEFAELGGVVQYLAETADLELVEPPAALRDRIMAAAAADLAARAAASGSAPAPAAAPSPTPFPDGAERTARDERTERLSRRGTSRLGWVAQTAAVVAIVVLGGWNLLLQGELSNARAYDRAIAAVIDAAGKPGSQTVVLTPAEGSRGSGIAAVAPDGSVVMAMRDLPPTAGTQVYEAWVIVGEAPPVPVGSFTVGPNGTAAVTTQPVATPPGSTIALSLEPAPGSAAPLGPIVATGVSTAPKS